MSDTATPGSLDAFLLDGDAPRLGAPPVLPPAAPTVLADAPIGQAGIVVPPPPDGSAPSLPSPSLPVSAPAPTPVLAAPDVPHDHVTTEPVGAAPAEPRHPMAHLMPAKSQPNESSVWAAELRAKKKAKARRTKIIASVVIVAICAIVGPPLGKWLVNAINESGSTKPDEPAATVPATVPVTTAPVAVTATAPVATEVPAAAPTTAGGLLGLPAQAETAVAGINGTTPVAPATTVAP